MSFPPFHPQFPPFHPDAEVSRLAGDRQDPAAVSVARCTYTGCTGGGGEARGPISSALLIHKAEAHSAASGHVVTIHVRPEAAPPGA